MNFFMVTSKRMSGSQDCEIFGQNEIRNRVVFVYLNPSSARDGHVILGSRSLRGTSGANKDSYFVCTTHK